MDKQTIYKFEQAIRALNGAVNAYSKLEMPLTKDYLYSRAFDTGEIYITPVSYNEDRNACDYEVKLTEAEKAAIRDMVTQRIISDAEKQKKYLEELADRVCSVIFDEH